MLNPDNVLDRQLIRYCFIHVTSNTWKIILTFKIISPEETSYHKDYSSPLFTLDDYIIEKARNWLRFWVSKRQTQEIMTNIGLTYIRDIESFGKSPVNITNVKSEVVEEQEVELKNYSQESANNIIDKHETEAF